MQLRLDSHALDNEDLRLFPVGLADHGQLLTDVGVAPAADLMLHPLGVDIAGGGSGGFGKHPVARPPQMGIHQPAHPGLAPDAVDMDNVLKGPDCPVIFPLFPEQIKQICHKHCQNGIKHGISSLPVKKAPLPGGRWAEKVHSS